MTGFNEYDKYDGLGLAELVRCGEVSPQELLDAAIERVEQHNPALNAVILKMYDLARAALSEGLPDGPLAGVPFLLKDLFAAYAGVPLTSGSRAYRSFIPNFDSELVRRFKKAGLVIFGKTSTPEFGYVAYTEPLLFGPTRNPWDLDRTPGGSSGGAGAAVAAGMVPIASGGDGGGSIRIPASHCGLFGLKPSRGRNPTGPKNGDVWQGANVEHVLTRSVRDSAAVLDATQGSDPGAPYVIAPPDRLYLEQVGVDPRPLKIAWDTASPVGRDVHPECVAAVEEAARLLEELGHQVVPARPGFDQAAAALGYVTMNLGEIAAEEHRVVQMFGSEAARHELELETRVMALLGRTISALDFVLALREWDKVGRAMGSFLQTFDLYLTPTVAQPPIRIGELKMKTADRVSASAAVALKAGRALKAAGLLERIATDNLAATPFTQLANMTGLPAMSVPLHWTSDGLPVGVQFVAPFGAEDLLFQLAGQLERARPWFDRRPPLVEQSGEPR
jgi:amidase